jgi:hypothetical protein
MVFMVQGTKQDATVINSVRLFQSNLRVPGDPLHITPEILEGRQCSSTSPEAAHLVSRPILLAALHFDALDTCKLMYLYRPFVKYRHVN